METSLIFDLINRFFLFIVLTVAGVAKAFDIKSISKPLQELGIPNKNIATTAGFVIMGIEISTGIMLLIPKVILLIDEDIRYAVACDERIPGIGCTVGSEFTKKRQ